MLDVTGDDTAVAIGSPRRRNIVVAKWTILESSNDGATRPAGAGVMSFALLVVSSASDKSETGSKNGFLSHCFKLEPILRSREEETTASVKRSNAETEPEVM